MKALEYLKQHPQLAIALAFLLTLSVGILDYFTGIELSFFQFYLIPISLSTWTMGRNAGITISVVSLIIWFASDRLGGHEYAQPATAYWNAAVRFCVFLVVAELLSRVRNALQSLQALSRLKSDLLALVSHEFNNSLTTMGLALDLLRDGEGVEISEHRAKLYSALHKAEYTLRQAATNFLNQARIESGRFILNICRTEIRTIIRESVALLNPLSEKRRIHISLDLPPQVIPVRGDPDALSLVINNLISNAIKYTQPEGHVVIRLVPMSCSPAKVLVAVEDDGPGIGQEDIQRIFSGYYRTDAAKSTLGYGLGLKVSRDLIDSHDSALEVESTPGKGSRFFFNLPIWQD